ncbi:replicative DNA helicase [Symbiobacterium thermophilum]|uniref:SF4 helicase domain-containing protein n=1 Tax=Symbiobacterium thermophilum TaxID=2734 RepID=A0A953I4P9_SYMTR|nr:DnaB-like helicase C-terminal domain-containing protein [Symbiobacterium thermophilum]MBY6276822.1 hypothetical protein [Symbiobacterium thermophilum]
MTAAVAVNPKKPRKLTVPIDSVEAILEPLVATVMTSADAAVAVEAVKPDDLPDLALRGLSARAVWQAITEIVKQGAQPDPVAVADHLQRSGTPAKLEGRRLSEVLEEIQKTALTHSSVETMCRIVRRYAAQQRVMTLARGLAKLAADDLEAEDLAAQVEALVTETTLSITAHETAQGEETIGELLDRVIAMYASRRPGEIHGIRTGLYDLDALLQGLESGEMTILAARPSVGKTALAQTISVNAALAGSVVLFVSAEMPSHQIGLRMLTSVGGLDSARIKGGLHTPEEWARARERLARLYRTSFVLCDSLTTVPQIRRTAMQVKRKYGKLGLIVVDYLQLLRPSNRYKGNRTQEVAEISSDLKRLAKELQCHLLVLSQMNRNIEGRKGGDNARPQLSDLRDSGQIEQDADVVLFLHREEGGIPGITEVIVAKHRNGPVGTAKLGWSPSRCTYHSLDTRHE